MRVAVSARGGSLDAQMDDQFGRCTCFVVVDTETMLYNTVMNVSPEIIEGDDHHAVVAIARSGATVLITGPIKVNLRRALQTANIYIARASRGTVKEVLEAYMQKMPRQQYFT
jgi:predicted Fe-Mo cluster-binding NifX family protein